MKKNDLILVTAVALYSLLFYGQAPGINFLVFSLALILLLLFRDRRLLKNKLWLSSVIASFLSGACVAYSGNTLSVVANILSLAALSAYSLSSDSLIFALLHSLYSYSSSLVFILVDRFKSHPESETNASGSPRIRKFTLILIPLLIALVFFFMYRGANVLFDEFAKKINFDFISLNWVAFTLGGFLLLYGFFHLRIISSFSQYDQRTGNSLDPARKTTISLFGKHLSIEEQHFSGVTLFIMLNVLLLIVNSLDFHFLFIDSRLPAGLSYSEFVHQGTGMLITSILAGVLIILFYFRGSLNFYSKGSILKLLAYLWIIQNICMLFSTSMRNNMYIAEYGLTYKRIGVYIYLLLTGIGLCTTIIKISAVKSNMFLFRVNSWIFFWLLIVSCAFNWDGLITDFNIHYSRQLEKKYLVELSNTNLPQLYELRADSLHKHKEFLLNRTEAGNDSHSYVQGWDFESSLNKKLFLFAHEEKTIDWRSQTYLNTSTMKKLDNVRAFQTVGALDVSSSSLVSLEGIEKFTSLKRLNLSNNLLLSISGIENLQQLEELNIELNPIQDYSPLYKLKRLKKLILPYNAVEIQKIQLQLPNTKIN